MSQALFNEKLMRAIADGSPAALNIISAIRGPDVRDDKKKFATTTPIRGWAAGVCQGDDGWYGMLGPLNYTPDTLRATIIALAKTKADEADHFGTHIWLAAVGICKIEGWD